MRRIVHHRLPWNCIKLGSGCPGAPPTSRHDRAILSGPSPGCARRAGEFLPSVLIRIRSPTSITMVLCGEIWSIYFPTLGAPVCPAFGGPSSGVVQLCRVQQRQSTEDAA